VLHGDDVVFAIINNSFRGEDKPVVGDAVMLEQHNDAWLIVDVEQRKNFIARYDHFKERYQGFAANVDMLFVVTSANREFSPARIRRFLALCGDQDIAKVIVLTKIDLAGDNLHRYVSELKSNFPTVKHIAINALDRAQVKKLIKFIPADGTMLLLGTSGVGKSTIINTLCGTNLKTGEVKDEKHFNKGKHITSSRNMYQTKCGRRVIDVPGVRIVGVEQSVAESSELFDKIAELATRCKFSNCKHQTEGVCAVKSAIQSGKLSKEELDWYFATTQNKDRAKHR